MKGVDDNVKRLIDFLRDAGELDSTVIIYTGDQGFFLGEHDLMDKRWIYEESMRMPFIVRDTSRSLAVCSSVRWIVPRRWRRLSML